MQNRINPFDDDVTVTYSTRQIRSSSCIDLTVNQESWQLTKESTLGKGTFAKVRLFSTSADENIAFAVKAPKFDIAFCPTIEKLVTCLASAEREAAMMKLAYPELLVYYFENPREITPSTGPGSFLADYRIISRYIAGKMLFDKSKEMKDIDEFIYLCYQIAVEIQRIHELDIIHGDLSASNIMVNTRGVFLIDFGIAYRSTDESASTANADKPEECYFAPERLNVTSCKPHTSQDVYSLCYTLKDTMLRAFNHKQIIRLYEQYPFLKSLLEKGLSKEPETRPSLPEFIHAFNPYLNKLKIKHAIANKNQSEALQILTDSPVNIPGLSQLFYFYSKKGDIKTVDYFLSICAEPIANMPELKAMASLFKLIRDLTKKTKSKSILRKPNPDDMDNIEQLSAAYTMAKTICNTDHGCLDTNTLDIIQSYQDLQSIYENLCQQNLLKPIDNSPIKNFLRI